ncbi:MAG: type IX secretion system periplasmic lipoprotein PorW/SprE [Lutibacter sp.]
MKTTLIKFIVVFTLGLLVQSCSTKKDAFLNRTYHSVSTKYNVLYNGNVAFNEGLKELNENYKDNYWQVLPIEPLTVAVLGIPGIKPTKNNAPKAFEKAEEKAVKAVQKHSMLIARQERNNQIDNAYLLLGKSRYYSKRFVPALEAFNYVLLHYPTADLIQETKVWQAKTLIRLQNPEQAIDNLNHFLKVKDLDPKMIEFAHTALAMAYRKTDSLKQEMNHLKMAVQTDFNKNQAARNWFILGQLYRNIKEIDSSNIAFEQLIHLKKIQRKYKIHAAIELAKNATSKDEKNAQIEALQKLIKNRDNRPFLASIYYQLGKLNKKSNDSLAMVNYKLSIIHSEQPNFQKELTYQALGDLFFEKANYLTAGAYYDSILSITKNNNTKRIRKIKRKRNNLTEVIQYEKVVKSTDSILHIVSMTKEEKTSYFNEYIKKLKEAETAKQNNSNAGNAFFNTYSNASYNSGKWYFYNVQTVGFGEQEFKKIWGNRPLEDNWRLSNKNKVVVSQIKPIVSSKINKSEKYKLSYYLNQLPLSKRAVDSIKFVRNNAYYKLGLIYKEQFKAYSLAISRLEQLLKYNPSEQLKLPAIYHLYKVYETLNNSNANQFKDELTKKYPNSRYAKLINNPKALIAEKDENSPEKNYEKLYEAYKDKKYDSVINQANKYVNLYEGKSILPKLELLKAYAIGKKNGLKAFRDALVYVALNFPNTDEGKKAAKLVEQLKAKLN